MKKHILLAEDEEQTRKTFCAILERAGYQVTAVADGRAALKEIITAHKGEEAFDLLITDIKMAGLDGLQLADQIGKLKMQVPMLAITGYGNKELVIELMRKGCLEYIEKPFEAVELLQRVAAIFKSIAETQQAI